MLGMWERKNSDSTAAEVDGLSKIVRRRIYYFKT